MSSGELLLAVENGVARSVPVTSLEAAGLLDRQHLQEWIVAHPRILGPGVLDVRLSHSVGFPESGIGSVTVPFRLIRI